MNNQKGFTLIELLIVIAIIGVLSTIILTGLSQSQARAYDSKITQQLSGFRTAAQIYSINHSGSFSPDTADCNEPTSIFKNVNAEDGSPGLYIDPGNLPDFTRVFCGASSREYAVKATLYSGTDYWCVDNTGASRMVSGTPVSGTFCP